MSAIENGEVLDPVDVQYVGQKSGQPGKNVPLSDDNRLLSDLENSADENNQVWVSTCSIIQEFAENAAWEIYFIHTSPTGSAGL